MSGHGVRIAFEIFRRIYPVGPWDPSERRLSAEERDVYHRWEIGALVPFFLFVPALVYGWCRILDTVAGLLDHRTPDTLFLVLPIWVYWFLPAALLGFVSTAIPMDLLYRLLLRQRYRRYLRACDERVGFDGKRAFITMAVLFLIGSLLGIVAGLTSFTRFTETGVEDHLPFSYAGRFHPYQSIQAIEHRATVQAPNGNIIARPHFVIIFNDGSSWSTEGFLRDPEPDRDDRIMRLVSKHSGRPIVEQP